MLSSSPSSSSPSSSSPSSSSPSASSSSSSSPSSSSPSSKSKYALFKNEDNLTEEQKDKLEQVKQVSPTLSKMHQLKEELRMIFQKPIDWLAALFELGNWLVSARQYYPKSQNTMLRWFDEIIAYFDHRTTNGMVESIDNKLKLIKRSAF